VGDLLVGVDELVLGERRAAARAPLDRPVTDVEPAALVHGLEKAPDVLDVRVREGVVVVVPVHPHPEPAGLLGDDLGELGHALLAPLGELREPVLLDLALRVQAEGALDPDFDPETLAVEAVLVALAEASHRLVALEDVLERAPPAVVRAHGVVRRDRAVDEAPDGPGGVLLAELLERLPLVPPGQDLVFDLRVIGYRRKRPEHSGPSLRLS
jgi:hypothetical protein